VCFPKSLLLLCEKARKVEKSKQYEYGKRSYGSKKKGRTWQPTDLKYDKSGRAQGFVNKENKFRSSQRKRFTILVVTITAAAATTVATQA
jgi:hypothetical protein